MLQLQLQQQISFSDQHVVCFSQSNRGKFIYPEFYELNIADCVYFIRQVCDRQPITHKPLCNSKQQLDRFCLVLVALHHCHEFQLLNIQCRLSRDMVDVFSRLNLLSFVPYLLLPSTLAVSAISQARYLYPRGFVNKASLHGTIFEIGKEMSVCCCLLSWSFG